MPIIKSAKKAARQTVKRTEHNQQIKKDVKTAIKAFRDTPTGENLAVAQSELDKAVKKGLIKLNTASRRKAALYQVAKAAGVVAKEAKKVEKSAKTAADKQTPAKKAPAKKAASTKKPAAKATPTKKPATKATTTKKSTTAKPAAKKPAPKAKAEQK